MSTTTLGPRARSEAELLAEGWKRRFVGGPPRLQEMVELYRTLGYEVWLEPPDAAEFGDECEGCTLALAFFRVIYTREFSPLTPSPAPLEGSGES